MNITQFINMNMIMNITRNTTKVTCNTCRGSIYSRCRVLSRCIIRRLKRCRGWVILGNRRLLPTQGQSWHNKLSFGLNYWVILRWGWGTIFRDGVLRGWVVCRRCLGCSV